MLTPGPNPTFERRDDGRVWVLDPMPDVLAITRQLLEHATSEIEYRGEFVSIRCANGYWVYHIAEWQDDGTTAVCVIKYREDDRAAAGGAR